MSCQHSVHQLKGKVFCENLSAATVAGWLAKVCAVVYKVQVVATPVMPQLVCCAGAVSSTQEREAEEEIEGNKSVVKLFYCTANYLRVWALFMLTWSRWL